MKHFTLTVGLERTATGGHIDPAERTFAIDRMKHALADQFGGYSAQPVSGGYVNREGKLTQEDAIRFDVVTNSERELDVRNFAVFARDLLSQESVLFEASQELDVAFI